MDWIVAMMITGYSLTVAAVVILAMELEHARKMARYYKGKYDLMVDADEIQRLFEGVEDEDGE